jgi:uncharacterized protein (TIGR00251 family)
MPIPPNSSAEPFPSYVSPDGPDCLVTIRVIPRSGRTRIDGVRAGALLVRLAAAPVEGAANDALLDLLATHLRVPPRTLTIASGQKSRDKKVRVTGLDAATLVARLSDALR